MNKYRATSPYGEAIWGNDEFDADFTPGEERDHLDGGHLEIVPRDYHVMSDNFSGGPKGSTYTAALRTEVEQALMQGGHLQRVEQAAPVEEPEGVLVEDDEEL